MALNVLNQLTCNVWLTQLVYDCKALNIRQFEICPLLITDVKSEFKTAIAQSSAAKVNLRSHSFQESPETKQILRLVFKRKFLDVARIEPRNSI